MDQAPSETFRRAKDEQCSRCSKPAEVFIGMADPDMPQHPMCAKCAEQYRLEVMMVLCGMEPRDFVTPHPNPLPRGEGRKRRSIGKGSGKG